MGNRIARYLALIAASTVAIIAFGSASASAQPQVSLTAPKTITLGTPTELSVTVNGVGLATLASAKYRVEVASFPYRKWRRYGAKDFVSGRTFGVPVEPRINSRYRVVVELKDQTVRSNPTLIFVQPIDRSQSKFLPGRVVIHIELTYDSSYGKKWRKVRPKHRKLYVYEACGTQTGPTTNYKRVKAFPVDATTFGATTTLSLHKVVKPSTCTEKQFYWMGYFMYAPVNRQLINGDNGYGKPKYNRQQTKRKQRLKLRRTLTINQEKFLVG